MSARVQRESSSVGPVVCELPPGAEVSRPVAAPKVCQATVDDIEKFRATENDARAGFVGRKLEEFFGGLLAVIPEGGKKDLELSMKGGEEVIGSAKVKLGVEHKDGKYLVTVQGAAGLGVGGLAKGADASVTAGASGAATFRFGSAKEAADALAAFVQVGAQAGMGGGLVAGVARVAGDGDALARTLHATGRLQSVDLALKVSAQASVSSTYGQVKVGLSGDVGALDDVKLDLVKGEVVFSTKLEAGLNGNVSRKLLGGALAESGQVADVRGAVSLEQHFPLSLQDIEKIQKGGVDVLKAIALDSARHSRTEAVVRLDGSVAGLDFKAERRGSPAEMLGALSEDSLFRAKDWSFQGFKVSGDLSADFDGGVLKLRASMKDRQTILTAKGQLAPLVQQGAAKVEETRAQERMIGARMVLSRQPLSQ